MKLYILRPGGHGEHTLIVCADGEAAAMAAFMESPYWPEVAKTRRLLGEGYYTVEIYNPGEVAVNDND